MTQFRGRSGLRSGSHYRQSENRRTDQALLDLSLPIEVLHRLLEHSHRVKLLAMSKSYGTEYFIRADARSSAAFFANSSPTGRRFFAPFGLPAGISLIPRIKKPNDFSSRNNSQDKWPDFKNHFFEYFARRASGASPWRFSDCRKNLIENASVRSLEQRTSRQSPHPLVDSRTGTKRSHARPPSPRCTRGKRACSISQTASAPSSCSP